MLQKTYRVTQMAKMYEEWTDLEKVFADKIILCYVQDEDEFIVTNEDFDCLLCDGHMPLGEVVNAFMVLNEDITYTFVIHLETYNSEDWMIRGTMLRKVYNNLNMEM